MRLSGNFHAAYSDLEGRMKAQVEADDKALCDAAAGWSVFLPNPEPEGPVDYLFICMEPSLGRWARSPQEAKSKVDEGFRNFLFSTETSILHFCIRHYLCEPTQRYHITDFSKGAMFVKGAGDTRTERYEMWYPLLKEEIDLVGPDAAIFAVGKVVSQNLVERPGFRRRFTPIIHYSPQAARWRSREIVRLRQEDAFEAFRGSVSIQDVADTMGFVLREAHVPSKMYDEALSGLLKSQLSTSRQRLIFIYKFEFERLAAQMRSPVECSPIPTDR